MKSYKNIIHKLIKKNINISIAESCTGGKLCSVFTGTPGVSKIFNMGLITYSNKSKNLILKIPLSILKKNGAVSEKVASLMVLNLFKISKSKLCISTTGIAGPGGGSKSKPIGLVYIGIKFDENIHVTKKIFNGNRAKIQKDTVNFCLKSIEDLI